MATYVRATYAQARQLGQSSYVAVGRRLFSFDRVNFSSDVWLEPIQKMTRTRVAWGIR